MRDLPWQALQERWPAGELDVRGGRGARERITGFYVEIGLPEDPEEARALAAEHRASVRELGAPFDWFVKLIPGWMWGRRGSLVVRFEPPGTQSVGVKKKARRARRRRSP